MQYRLTIFTSILALTVVMFGAYVRLSDAGLGCPDWPGCYGQIGVPSAAEEVADANSAYPHRPVEAAKAWKEMVHRYLAGALGLLILLLALIAIKRRKVLGQPLLLPLGLLALVIFQALLGMWTVTLLVKPAIVTAHLLGGFATLALLWLLALRLRTPASYLPPQSAALQHTTLVGLLILIGQIALGGWTSTNYAAIGCVTFPECYPGDWWPSMDFGEAFVIWRGLGINYEFGVLSGEARAAIHVAHRLGALVTTLYLLFLGLQMLMSARGSGLRRLAQLMLFTLFLQLALGITNVLAQLPLLVAVAHNGTAALLTLVLVTQLWLIYQSRRMMMEP